MSRYKYKIDINYSEHCARQNQLDSCWECAEGNMCKYYCENLEPIKEKMVVDCIKYCMSSVKTELHKQINNIVDEYTEAIVKNACTYLRAWEYTENGNQIDIEEEMEMPF